MRKTELHITILAIILTFNSLRCLGQVDSAITLEGVEILSIRQSAASPGSKSLMINSSMLDRFAGGNLADLLAAETSVFIKSYGQGSLATSSFRGGSAAHTAVLWNGIPINSPTTGQVDFSLIPVNFFNNSRIDFGGGSSLWGSGAIGGVVQLERKAEYNQDLQLNVSTQIGSFEQFGNQVNLSFGKKKYAGFAGIAYRNAKNNFPIISKVESSNTLLQRHSSFKQLSVYTDHHFRVGLKNTLSFHHWSMLNDREIPPTLLESNNQSTQQDASHRSMISWLRTGVKTKLESRISYLNEEIAFVDPKAQIDSKTGFESVILQSELQYQIHRGHRLIFGLSETYTTVQGDNFSNRPRQNQAALFASHLYNSKSNRFRTNISIRQELLDLSFVPLVYSGGLSLTATDWISFRIKASKDYRIPTLNDRYWQPGGNIDLQPESGFSQEVGSDVRLSNNSWNFSFSPTLFNRLIENWIIWLPSEGTWSPQNILSVWSRGSETTTQFGFKKEDWVFTASISTSYVVSTSQKPMSANDQSVEKQLIYVPMYSGNGNFSIQRNNLSIAWIQNYTGYRYTASDHSDFLAPFWTSSIHASWYRNSPKLNTTLFARINNIFNQEYQLIQNRPMPGRNFQFGLDLTFKHKSKNA